MTGGYLMSQTTIGILFGIIAGIVDICPMIFMKLPWTADLSAFSMWVIIGFFIAASNLKLNGILKGILISYLVLFPTAILIRQNNLMDLIPIIMTTFILGSVLGLMIEKCK